ncbi:hypothetical protein KAS50_08145 [bacterium]|nr:hypothetical protein [bacterium]
MKINRIHTVILLVGIFMVFVFSAVSAQRLGGLPDGSISKNILISNGPKGPICGGESAVTDMLLMDDGWIYGSTKASWGGRRCHLFRTDSDKSEHVLNVTAKLRGQTAVTDLDFGTDNTIIGCTSTYNEIFDKKNNYEGGHIFSYNPATGEFIDFGIIADGQGINCIAADIKRSRIYGVTYPAGRLFAYNLVTKEVTDFGEVMHLWRVKHMGRVSWRGVPKVLMIDDAGTVYYSSYYKSAVEVVAKEKMRGGFEEYATYEGGRIFRLPYGSEKPEFTGAVIPTQTGMDGDPAYENGIASAVRAKNGGFWCGTINDGFLFKYYPSTSTVINKGKPFQYWNLKSLAYGGDDKLYMLGGRDYDNQWLLCYDGIKGSIDCLGWPDNTTQCSVICADKDGRILFAENLRHSFIRVYEPSKR